MVYNHTDYCREWRKKNKHKIKLYNQRAKDRIREWKKANRSKIKITDARSYQLNKYKHKLRQYAYHHLRKSLINEESVCSFCGSKDRLELHHKTYKNNDLNNLIVLCKKCHTKETVNSGSVT